MPKYPITPEYIKSAPHEIERLYRQLEAWILQDICERFKLSESATSTALEQIKILQRRGYSYEDIKKYIKATLKLTDAEFNRIMGKAIEDNQRYYSYVLDEDQLVKDVFESGAMKQEVDAIIAQCKGNLDNITQSLGFSVNVNGHRQYLPIAQAYQRILSDAEIKVWSGAQSYNEALRDAVKQLTDSGMKTVTWSNADGVYHTDNADVAARRAIMTGITQLSSKYSEQIREEVPTEYMEITAHVGARDTDKPGIPWANHKRWQGKVYSTEDNDKYPSVYKVCGWGDGDGLEGWNCRHLHFPFWDGISERTYTDEQLANLDPPPFDFQGKRYTAYSATQMQRQIERSLRKVKREILGFKASGNDEAYTASAVRYRRLKEQYDKFNEASGLRATERGNIAEFGPKDAKEADTAVANSTISVNSNAPNVSDGKEARAKDVIRIEPAPYGMTAMKAKHIYRELQKSEVGRQAYDYIVNSKKQLTVTYTDEVDPGLRGITVGSQIEVYAVNTQSVVKTAQTIIHEANHGMIDSDEATLWEEAYCIMQERKHLKAELTISDLRDIIKEAKDLYPELKWRARR